MPELTLDDIARDPVCAQTLSDEELRPLLAKAELICGALRSRWFMVSAHSAPIAQPDGPDRMLRVDEAARRIGVAVDTLYRNADEYPFTRRPRPRCLRFSEKGIAEYLKAKSASDDADSAASIWRNRRYGHD